jgi:hypothetical protein
VQVLLKERPPERELWLLVRRDLTKVSRVKALAEYITEVFRRGQTVLAGG